MKTSAKKILTAGISVIGATAAISVTGSYLFKIAAARKRPAFPAQVQRAKKKRSVYNPFFEDLAAGKHWFLTQNFEKVSIVNRCGFTLTGHYLPAESAKRTILLMHGWRSSWYKDFCVVARFLHENNCNILLAEQRSHGESDGKYIGFGVLERYDCVDWVQYLVNRFGDNWPLYLDGISMGATTVLMATGLQLPASVHGIIADCGFTAPKDIFLSVLSKRSLKGKRAIVAFTNTACKVSAGYSLSGYSTLDALQTNTRPILFIHGSEDDFVPPKMTFENFAACKSPKKLLIVNGAAHGMSYLIDKHQYQTSVLQFFSQYDNFGENCINDIHNLGQ